MPSFQTYTSTGSMPSTFHLISLVSLLADIIYYGDGRHIYNSFGETMVLIQKTNHPVVICEFGFCSAIMIKSVFKPFTLKCYSQVRPIWIAQVVLLKSKTACWTGAYLTCLDQENRSLIICIFTLPDINFDIPLTALSCSVFSYCNVELLIL